MTPVELEELKRDARELHNAQGLYTRTILARLLNALEQQEEELRKAKRPAPSADDEGRLDRAGRELFAVHYGVGTVAAVSGLNLATVEQMARDNWPAIGEAARTSWREHAKQILEAAFE